MVFSKEYSETYKELEIYWKPTNPKCGFTSLIGLCMYYKLKNGLPEQNVYKFKILIGKGFHHDFKESFFSS